jgi:hypothetical protein
VEQAQYRKNPDTEKRVARPNDRDDWVVREQPELRIVSDALWTAVKKRQLEVEQSFSHTTTNRLSKAHRPQYLLSGILECAHCFGPYAIMAKDRYGCANRQKKLPIEHLGGIVCTNSKTISHFELEERVVSAVPDNLLDADNLDRINRDIKAAVARGQQRAVVEPERLRTEITAIETKQKALGEKIAERIVAGHAVIPALDQMLNDLEQQRLSLASQLAAAPSTSAHAVTPPLNAGMLKSAIAAVKTMLSTWETGVQESWISIARQLVQKVVIAPSADGKSAELTIHGRLAAILAAQEAWREVSRELRDQQSSEFVRKRSAGEFKSLADKTKFLRRCEALLAEQEQEWMVLQVSVVAGAGFEPARPPSTLATVSLFSRNIQLKLLDMLVTDNLHQFQQMRRPLTKPHKRLFANLEMFRIPSLNIGFVDCVKPGSLPVVIAWKGFHQAEVLLFRK